VKRTKIVLFYTLCYKMFDMETMRIILIICNILAFIYSIFVILYIMKNNKKMRKNFKIIEEGNKIIEGNIKESEKYFRNRKSN